MEATRIVRGGRRPASPEQTVVGRAPRRPAPEPADGAPRPETPLEPERARFLERLALVALVFGRERAAALLGGLSTPEDQRARDFLTGFTALSSARRQARVAVEFGGRPDAAARLRAVMEEAPEVLRGELFRRLPPYHRSLFPERRLEPPDASVTEAVCAWAERLLREATR